VVRHHRLDLARLHEPSPDGVGFMVEKPVALVVALVTLASLLKSQEPKKIPWNRNRSRWPSSSSG